MPAAALTISWPICWALTQQLVDLGNRARHILGEVANFRLNSLTIMVLVVELRARLTETREH
jgi:hypothetical protein